jgi:hypothetical protein
MSVRVGFWLHGFSLVVVCGLLATVCRGQVNRQLPSSDDRLKSALQSYLQDKLVPEFEPTNYNFAFVDLAGRGKREAVVYVSGRGWCGTGGCRMLVLTQAGSSYKVIAKIPTVRPPIRVLESKSHGWRDLSVWIQGGGILQGYEEKVKFDGNTYSKDSPQTDEERPVRRLQGKIILSGKEREVQLYP